MTPVTAMLVALATPVLAAVAAPLLGRWRNLREGTTLALAGVTFWAAGSLVPVVRAGGSPELVLAEFLPGIPLALRAEPLGVLFALVASSLWAVTTVYSAGYLRAHGERNQSRFYACFALAIAGALGVALARNAFTLFVSYEFLTLTTYPLVTHHGTPTARRAGRVYLGVLLGTSISMLLLALAWTWRLAGTLEFRPGGILAGRADGATLAILLTLFAFGTGKAALMPFHRWLPAAMVAPAPVSALLHAVAVVKAGVFTVLKIVVYLFGADLLRDEGAGHAVTWIAAATILLASLVALTRDNLKERLAYSTISQLGYVVLGAALATPAALVGAGMHIAMHALGKITLFFCAGAIQVALHKTEIRDMRGIGRRMPVTLFCFLVAALSVIGLPPLGGAWSKWYLALGAVEAGQLALVAVLMLSSLLNIAYLMPIPVRAFFPAAGDTPGDRGRSEAPLACVVPLCLTAAGCVALFVFGGRLQALLLPLGR